MMTASKARPLRLVVLAMAPGPLCVGTPASADTRAGVDLSAGASAESNPYLASGGIGDVALSFQVDPWLKLSDPISSIDLHGDLSLRQYSKSANGTDITGTVDLSASRRLSPYFSISGGVNYLTSLNGINLGFANVAPTEPLPPFTTPLPDISLGGTRTRTHSASANVGVSAALSPLDQISASFTASRSTYNSTAGSDYTYLNGGLNYARTLSRHLSLTASVRYGKSDYSGTSVGDGTIITPEVGFNLTLSERMTLNASFGASFSRSNRLGGTKANSTSFSGQVNLCRSAERGAFCLTAAQSAQPTGLGGISTVTDIGIGYNTRVSSRDTLSFNLGFDRSKGEFLSQTTFVLNGLPLTAFVVNREDSKYIRAGGSWSHSFSRRFFMYVSPGYSRITNSSTSRSNSFTLSAGLRYSFGAIS